MTTHYINPDTQLTDYMVFPRFLLALPVNETAKLVYLILLDRIRLSCRNPDWCDHQNRVFVIYPIEHLARRLGKGLTVIKNALASLEKHRLIKRKHQGIGKANRIYVLIPESDPDQLQSEIHPTEILTADNLMAEKATSTLSEKRPQYGRFSEHLDGGKAAGNKNNKSKNYKVKKRSENIRRPHGRYKNVFLSDEELALLKNEVPNWNHYIERLSCHMKASGKEYRDHAATILGWANRDRYPIEPELPKKDYSFKEGESL